MKQEFGYNITQKMRSHAVDDREVYYTCVRCSGAIRAAARRRRRRQRVRRGRGARAMAAAAAAGGGGFNEESFNVRMVRRSLWHNLELRKCYRLWLR